MAAPQERRLGGGEEAAEDGEEEEGSSGSGGSRALDMIISKDLFLLGDQDYLRLPNNEKRQQQRAMGRPIINAPRFVFYVIKVTKLSFVFVKLSRFQGRFIHLVKF